MPTTTVIPFDVLSAIKASPTQGNLVSVLADPPYSFNGQVLKADTITFGPGGRLLMEALDSSWVAIVAKTIKIAAPDERAFVLLPTDRFIPTIGVSHPYQGSAASGGMGEPTRAGSPGQAGVNGLNGNRGSAGHSVPHLYILADRIVRQSDGAPPDFVDLFFLLRGIDGGDGGPGQDGQSGGAGGSGGPARWNGISCDGGAGDGAAGGAAGGGGDGGDSGNGSDGGNLTVGGSALAISILEFSKVNSQPGHPGHVGQAGANGSPGNAGPRGERRGGCGGGSAGPAGATSSSMPSPGTSGLSGSKGLIYTATVAVAATLF